LKMRQSGLRVWGWLIWPLDGFSGSTNEDLRLPESVGKSSVHFG
jgi:hypothetical protein